MVQALFKQVPTVVCDAVNFKNLIGNFLVGETIRRPDYELQIIALYKWQPVINALPFLTVTLTVFQKRDVSANRSAGPEKVTRCCQLLLRRLAYYFHFSFHERVFSCF